MDEEMARETMHVCVNSECRCHIIYVIILVFHLASYIRCFYIIKND